MRPGRKVTVNVTATSELEAREQLGIMKACLGSDVILRGEPIHVKGSEARWRQARGAQRQFAGEGDS